MSRREAECCTIVAILLGRLFSHRVLLIAAFRGRGYVIWGVGIMGGVCYISLKEERR